MTSPGDKPAVFYCVPDTNHPSWGVGMLYGHVELLRRNGINATIVHEHEPFRVSWLKSTAPVTYLHAPAFSPRPRDILVVPEINAVKFAKRRFRCRRLVFVQGSFLMLDGMPRKATTYRELGYECAIAILPHVKEIVEQYLDVPATVIPPYIAPYFYIPEHGLKESAVPSEQLAQARAKRLVVFPKSHSRDYDILLKILRRCLAKTRRKMPAETVDYSDWQLIELRSKSHRQVAQILQKAAFFVNLNCQEGFNTSVPEAMAAGCIPFCYEAYGGRDFLRNRGNAYVFPNHDVYPLLNQLLTCMQQYDEIQPELTRMRAQAYQTAGYYTQARTEQVLLDFYRTLLEL